MQLLPLVHGIDDLGSAPLLPSQIEQGSELAGEATTTAGVSVSREVTRDRLEGGLIECHHLGSKGGRVGST
jgi:hypothetical protein